MRFALYFIFLNTISSIFNIPVNQAQISVKYIFAIAFTTVGGGILFSSIYHSFELARIKILSDGLKPMGTKLKSGLVILQMALSVIFLISTFLVYKQISFMKNKDLGIALNEVIVCTGPASLNADPNKRQRFEGFKMELESQPGVEAVTFNTFVPGQEPSYGFHEFRNPEQGKAPDNLIFENNAGQGFIHTFNMRLLAGRDFSKNPVQDTAAVILTEMSARLLGFKNPQDAIGKRISRKGTGVFYNSQMLNIVGVVADFHNEGLHKSMYPMIWNNRFPSEFGYFSIRLNTKNMQESVQRFQSVWGNHYPKDNFDFVFANDQFNKQYESDNRFSKLYVWLTLLSIGIATIGLYGLILYYLEKRKKEISLRKVNGATIGQIVSLINFHFMKWILIACVFAMPIAWFAMHKWLENFAYKTKLSWWIFVLAGALVMGIALLTVSLQSWRAATRNPVEALRYE